MEDTTGTKLAVAQVASVSFQALSDGDEEEQRRLIRACSEDGFFYLDMNGTAPDIGHAVQDIYQLERELFALTEEELIHYDIDRLSAQKKLNGYKPLGRNFGELAGRIDGFQSYALPKDGIMKLGTLADFEHPSLVDAYMTSLQTFAGAISKAAEIIFASLSSSLRLEREDNLCDKHHSHLSSPDLIRLLKYHALPLSERGSSHVPHTDLGSLTFLFAEKYGLQILGAESGEWEWMQPKEGYATVNIGDCMSMLTNQKLRSCRHRVRALPGQAMRERYSYAYFMRPDDGVLLKPVTSPLVAADEQQKEVFTSGEWLKRKYATLRRDTWKKDENWILNGT